MEFRSNCLESLAFGICSFKQLIHMSECSAVLQSLPSPSLYGSSSYVVLSRHMSREKSESGF